MKTKIKTLIQIILWLIVSAFKWVIQALPRTKYQASLFINLLAINYVVWVLVFLPIVKPVIADAIFIKPIEIIRTVEKYISVDKIVVKAPAKGTDERYYYLLENNKVFREYINSLNVKRNNPGNLRCANQLNSTCEGGFAKFPDVVDGFRALVKQCELDQSRDLTLRQFITKFSPHSENDTEHLIRVATNKLNLEEQELINYLDTIKLAQFMVSQEFSIEVVDF